MYIIWHEKTALKHISMFPLPDCRSPSLHFDLPKSTSPKHTNGNFYKWTRPSPKFLFLSGVKSRFVPPSRDTTTLYPAHLCHTHYCVRAAEPSTQPHTLWYYTATTYFIAVVTVVSLESSPQLCINAQEETGLSGILQRSGNITSVDTYKDQFENSIVI